MNTSKVKSHTDTEVAREARRLFADLEAEPNVYAGWLDDPADRISSRWALLDLRGYDVEAADREIRSMAAEIKAVTG